MARIAGVDLPREKRADIGRTSIFGIGRSRAEQILKQNQIKLDTKIKDLTDEEVNRLRETIEKEYKVEGELRREVAQNVKRLLDIGCYRGIRHRRGLPVRGQKTRTNARTSKGPKRTVAKKRK